jgi:hypothetical protein
MDREIQGRTQEAKYFTAYSTVSPILDDEGKIATLVRVDDITRKKIEQKEIDRVLKTESSQIGQSIFRWTGASGRKR